MTQQIFGKARSPLAMQAQAYDAYAYAYANHVLTGNNSDISLRGTQSFDILMLTLMLTLMLMSRPSSLVHKLMLESQVGTGLKMSSCRGSSSSAAVLN